METKARDGADGSASSLRAEGLSGSGDGKNAAPGVSGRDSVALSDALASLTVRERAIFDAGVAEGAAQTLRQLAEQHMTFCNAATLHADARQRQAVKMLAASKGAAAGAALARRVLAAGKALLGKP